MEALILAAGRGTRMRGLCAATPKPMLPLGNVPALEYILRSLDAAGVKRAGVVFGHQGESLRRELRPPRGMEVGFIEQRVSDGTGSAARLGREWLRKAPFILLFADIVVPLGECARLAADFAGTKREAMLSARHVPDPCAGAAVYVAERRVTRIVEKPPRGTSATNFDSAGLFVMPPRLFEYLDRVERSPRGEYELTDAIAAMVADDVFFAAHVIEGFWFNLTDPEALLAANACVIGELGEMSAGGARTTGPVAVAEDAEAGRCRLGPNVSVGPGCVVEDEAWVADAILMRGARIGRGARVRRAILAPGAVVPPGATLLGADEAQVIGAAVDNGGGR